MAGETITACPACGGCDIGVGYLLGGGRLFPDRYAWHSGGGSEVECILCRSCGRILSARALMPQRFPTYGQAQTEAISEYFADHGLLLCNAHSTLPSLDAMGWTMEALLPLIERREVFYCKVLQNRSCYLSREAYLLLARCKQQRPLTDEAAAVLKSVQQHPDSEKDVLRAAVEMDKKAFDKAFDFLLQQLYLTAGTGRRMQSGWCVYGYVTAVQWRAQVPGLHFSGDAAAALRRLMPSAMTDAEFKKLL